MVAVFDDHLMVGASRCRSGPPAADVLLLATLAGRLTAVSLQVATCPPARPATAIAASDSGHRSLEFRQLGRVIFTLSQAGYDQISLAVLQSS